MQAYSYAKTCAAKYCDGRRDLQYHCYPNWVLSTASDDRYSRNLVFLTEANERKLHAVTISLNQPYKFCKDCGIDKLQEAASTSIVLIDTWIYDYRYDIGRDASCSQYLCCRPFAKNEDPSRRMGRSLTCLTFLFPISLAILFHTITMMK